MSRSRWVWDDKQGKLVEYEQFHAPVKNSVHIIRDIEAFVSPITGEEITSRSQLRRHNKRHGVTDSRDYSQAYYDKAKQQREATMQGQTREARAERIETIKRAIEEHTR
jgi:anti-sigma28 factor (negative regulator of flagellin synthesis)